MLDFRRHYLITKAIIQSINSAGTRCIVRMPLFETAANPNPVLAEALVNIAPGMFGSLEVGDIVFISFEESAIERPIILGKLFIGAEVESNIHGGGGVLDTLKVRSSATIPASTSYDFPASVASNYKDLNTPKKTADYVLWLEKFAKGLFSRLEDHFTCLKNWVQWQLRPENVEIDDGDIDLATDTSKSFLYQDEGGQCDVCGKSCTKNNKRTYLELPVDKNYPDV